MSQNTAYIFPGQGSQSKGMLSELAEDYPEIKSTFSEASEVLGYDLWDLVQNDDSGKLNQTEITQPALLAASVAVFRCLQHKPMIMAGHSLGEYSALVCAGAIQFQDAVKLVELRGQLMQEAVPEGTGAMAAVIGLDDSAVGKACAESASGDVISPVNYNSPGQVVIAGHKAAVERASEACKTAGAKRVLPLPVSVPSHCALMKPAADKLAEALANVQIEVPETPVVHNVNVEVAITAEEIRKALVEQLYSPVRWTETVQRLADEGVSHLYEVGPGKVLTGLAKRIDRSLTAVAVGDSESVHSVNENFGA